MPSDSSDALEADLERAFTLLDQGDIHSADRLFHALLERDPGHPFVAFGCGAAALQIGNYRLAAEYLQRAVTAAPAIAQFHEMLGKAMFAAGELVAAADGFRQALARSPGLAESEANLGLILNRQGQREDAIAHLQRAIAIDPRRTVFRLNLASVLWNEGRVEEALLQLGAAYDVGDDRPSATLALLDRLHTLGRSDEVDRLLDTVGESVSWLPYRAVLAGWRLPVIARSIEDIDRRWEAYAAEVAALAKSDGGFDVDALPTGSGNFYAAYQNRDVRETQEAVAAFYARACPALTYVAPHLRDAPPGRTGGRIHIAFVSAFLSNHTIGKLYGRLIKSLDREAFEVSLCTTAPPDDEIGRSLANAADRTAVLPGSLAAMREALCRLRPDILFYPDIGMVHATYFLAFSRLAPVQCVGLGHPVTTGLPTIDYFISCRNSDLPNAQCRYTETLVRLEPLPFVVAPVNVGGTGTLPEMGFAAARTLYVCVQSLFKVHPEFDHVMAAVLRRDPKGVIAFVEGMAGWSEALQRRWRETIPDVADRIHFVGRMDQTTFLLFVQQATVVLDTIHFGGGNTTAEALMLGKAVVTWPGHFAPGRVSAAYYRRIGVLDCIAESPAHYVEIAVRLGTDAAWRSDIERRIRERAARLVDIADIVEAYAGFFRQALAAAVSGTIPPGPPAT